MGKTNEELAERKEHIAFLIDWVASSMACIEDVPLFISNHYDIYDAMLAVQGFLVQEMAALNE